MYSMVLRRFGCNGIEYSPDSDSSKLWERTEIGDFNFDSNLIKNLLFVSQLKLSQTFFIWIRKFERSLTSYFMKKLSDSNDFSENFMPRENIIEISTLKQILRDKCKL